LTWRRPPRLALGKRFSIEDRAMHRLIPLSLALLALPAAALNVSSFSPAGNANNVPRASAVVVQFDAPVAPASVTTSSLRLWSQMTGSIAATRVWSNGNRTLTLTPARPFPAGDWVTLNLAKTITGADSTTLRNAGYTSQFLVAAARASVPWLFGKIDTVSVRATPNETVVLYGGNFTDLNHDHAIDYLAINEVSADVRVLLNRNDGSGKLAPYLRPPSAVGFEASPSEVADFNNDGHKDLATSNTSTASISILLGRGDGTFLPQQSISVGGLTHGIAALDVDGDADIDLVSATESGNAMYMSLNNGSGVFSSATSFDSGGNGEYALASGDMNGDSISDLVVGTRNDQRIRVLTGNGNGTFTQTSNQVAGGLTWKLVLGDVNNDGKLDVANVNSFSNNGTILLGLGNGSLSPPTSYPFDGHMVASDLGDLDGDGDLDWVTSSYGANRWYLLRNNGDGSFVRDRQLMAPNNASCASLYDIDNDGDLDLALADEIADVVVLYQNDTLLFKNGLEL
jgi:hypothetical protein